MLQLRALLGLSRSPRATDLASEEPQDAAASKIESLGSAVGSEIDQSRVREAG